MYAFMSLIISIGLIVIDYLEDYRSTDPMCKLPFYTSVMRKERFCLILSFLHHSKKEQFIPEHDPIFKIRNFFVRLTFNFKSVFCPGERVAFDEATVA